MIVFRFGSKRYFTTTLVQMSFYLYEIHTYIVTILFEFDIEVSLGVAKCFEFVTLLWRENILNFNEQNKLSLQCFCWFTAVVCFLVEACFGSHPPL